MRKLVVLDVWCLACCLVSTHLATHSLLITCLFIIGGLSKEYAADPRGASSNPMYGNVAVMFLFQGFYSIAWMLLLYFYPLEIMK